MNAAATTAGAADNLSGHVQSDRPGPTLSVDPDTMHPRAIEMAEAMREGATAFRDLIGAGFTPAEIGRFHEEARALAICRAERQVAPSPDRLSEMIDKARAAIANRMPLAKGAGETQAMVVAWNRYCMARNAYRLDAWDGQRERCAVLLHAFFRQTPVRLAVADFVVRETVKTMGARH